MPQVEKDPVESNDPWTNDELAGLMQDVLDGQSVIRETLEEIIEKLTNIGLDR